MKWLYLILSILIIAGGCKDTKTISSKKTHHKASSKKYKSVLKAKKPEIDSDSDGIADYQDRESPVPEAHPIIIEERQAGSRNEAAVTAPPVIKAKNAKVVDKTDSVFKASHGTIAYSVPDTMTVGIKYSVKIRISKDGNKKELVVGDTGIPINDVDVHSTITIEQVRVAPVMSASLTSSDNAFTITSLSTETQNIEDAGYTEWEWAVTPSKSGDNQLKLIVKVRIVNEQGGFFKDIVVFDRTIKTKANIRYETKGFFAKYWQWLVTTFIIPIFIWWWRRKKKKDEPEKKE